MELQKALRLIAGIRQIDPEMPLQQAHCFLLIAEAEDGLSLSELASKANIGLATASRYVGALGKINRHREAGLQIIESFEDPMERRKKIIRLTLKGKLALKQALGVKYADLPEG
jgi:DNA-binding MarR family transcriptional regulator